MKIAIGCDHGGLELKKELIKYLKESGHDAGDFGTYSKDRVDYPDIAFMVAIEVSKKNYDFGIIVDTTGIASSIAANKVKGIRATPCYNTELAISAREHNNANILTLGAGIIGPNIAMSIVDKFISTKFLAGRHEKRLIKISEYETANSEEKVQYEKPKEVVTRDHLIILLKENKKVVYVTDRTIITPLAKEFAREKGIRIIKR